MWRIILPFTLVAAAACEALLPLDSVAYEYQVSHHPLSIILFTARGCQSCKEVATLIEEVKAENSEMPMGIINCSVEPKICDEARIFAVPKLMLSVGDDVLVPYTDHWSKKSVADFIERQMGSAITSITSIDDARFVEPTTISIVASIPANHATLRGIFAELAEKWRHHYKFFLLATSSMTTDDDDKQPELTLFKPFDEKRIVFQGRFDISDLETFLQSETLPLIKEMDPLLYDRHVEHGLPLAHIWGTFTECSQLAAALYPFAKSLHSQISFITVDIAQYPSRGKQLRLGEDSEQGFAIEDVKTTRMYPMRGSELSAATVEKFVTQFLEGKVEPVVLSDKPYKDENAPLVRLTADEFENVVWNRSRDVLVMFDVPWCEYCTELQDKLEKLGTQYQELGLKEQVILARVDVSTNDVPVRVTGYPTIKLWRAGTNEVRPFNGTYHSLLTIEELAEFVQKEGANTVDIGAQSPGTRDEL